MRRSTVLVIMMLLSLVIFGCGKAAKESGSSGSSGGGSAESVYFSSSVTPNVSFVHYKIAGEGTDEYTEYLVMQSSVTLNLSSYTIRNTTGNVQVYSFEPGTSIHPGDRLELYSRLSSYFDRDMSTLIVCGWGVSNPIWVAGASKLELRNASGVLLQSEQF